MLACRLRKKARVLSKTVISFEVEPRLLRNVAEFDEKSRGSFEKVSCLFRVNPGLLCQVRRREQSQGSLERGLSI
jgi:hypothetical protein